MKKEDFLRWFNSRSFWRAFKDKIFPIEVPASKENKEELLNSLFDDIQSARYAPNIPEIELVVNKGYGVARTIPVFSVRDYCVYYFCIKELEDVLCGNRTPNTFGGWTLGGQLRKQEHDEIEGDVSECGRYSFDPHAWTHAFGEFNALLFSQLSQGGYIYVLQLDLSNFYDSIRLDILERWIREYAPSEKGWVIALLFYFLNHWNRRNTSLHPQVVGLPQDALADCSRILANFYLQKYDQFAFELCSQAEAVYFRYADDQMILLNNSKQVENILLLLTRNLDRYGLRVNQKKVKLWKADDLSRHRCRRIQEIFSEKGDNKNPVLVEKFARAYLSLSKEEIENSWNRGMPLLNRMIWANLESLHGSLYRSIILRLRSKSFLLQSDANKIKRLKAIGDARKDSVNIIKRIKVLAKRSLHNQFHYEALYFARETKNSELESFLEERIEELRRTMSLNRIEV